MHCHRNSKAAFIDIGSGRSTTQDLAATAQSRAPKIDLAAHMAGVRTNYDATYGAGSYDALIAKGRAEDAATQARVDAARAQSDRELIVLFGSGPIAAGIAIAAPAIGAAAGTYLGATTAVQAGVTGAAGAGLNVGFEFGKNNYLGEENTAGRLIGAGITGGIFAGGFNPFRTGSAAVNNIGGGALGGFLGNFSGQAIDRSLGNQNGIDTSALTFNTVIGGAGGFVGGQIGDLKINGLTAGSNNFVARFNGKITARANGFVQDISPLLSVKGGVGKAVAETPRNQTGNLTQAYLEALRQAQQACQKDPAKCGK